MKEKLIIGKIPYANFFPLFHVLEKYCDGGNYQFIEGVPSDLNAMLREGKLDISPSSSVEYLRSRHTYRILPWFSVSSSGSIQSILLFSKVPIEKLGGARIALSSESETSSALLKIIIDKFLSLSCAYEIVEQTEVDAVLSRYSAVLLIGDSAMIESKRIIPEKKVRKGSPGSSSRERVHSHSRSTSLYIYDLGKVWDIFTGLPFVFALWVVRREALAEKGPLLKKFAAHLIQAQQVARKEAPVIARAAPLRKWLTEEELISYWSGISYEFTERHLQGLGLFEQYLLGESPSVPVRKPGEDLIVAVRR